MMRMRAIKTSVAVPLQLLVHPRLRPARALRLLVPPAVVAATTTAVTRTITALAHLIILMMKAV